MTVTPAPESGISEITQTGTLGDGDNLEMDKLPKGAEGTVTEASVPANYDVSAKLNGSSVDVSASEGESAKDYTVTGTLTEDENEVVVTNTLENIPITGIDVPVLYLELLIAAGAFLALIAVRLMIRRKKM